MAHILVIEDDAEFRTPLVKMLTGDGHTVSIAQDGTVALAMLETLQPDLIITDILMPNMDGIEMIAELSRLNYAVPIIAMSGGPRSLTAESTEAPGAFMRVTATLAKPFSRADLRRAIQASLASLLPRGYA